MTKSAEPAAPQLREAAVTRQIAGEPPRRWFSSSEIDLIVWEAPPGTVAGFQLCYDKGGDEHAVMWWQGRGFTHWRVAQGDRDERPGHKGSPILIESQDQWAELAQRLTAQADEVPRHLLQPILACLQQTDG